MKNEGVVIRLEDNFAIVGVKRLSACDTCRAKCGGHCDKASMVETKVKNTLNTDVGDTVVLFTDTKRVLLYAFAVFVLPLIFSFAGYVIANKVFNISSISLFSAILFFSLTFFVIWLIWGRKDANENIKMIEIKENKND